jgi:hypothetical protein
MGALNIAFDITIVGTLALCWVVLIVHLFFLDEESGLESLLEWMKEQNQPAVAGVLLFAMAYSLGSAVSRIARDFFNDEDLYIKAGLNSWGVTEDRIRIRAYCRQIQQWQAQSSERDRGPAPFQDSLAWFLPLCEGAANNLQPDVRENLQARAQDIFHLRESSLQLQGEDKTERLRQLHDQIMVLRGAAFNGFIAFSFCLFGWCAKFRSKLRWVLPFVYFAPALIALVRHLQERPLVDPPYMEFTLLVLWGAGCYLLWKRARPEGGALPRGIRTGFLILAFLLTLAATLGWWSTEVLYDQQVMYTYYAQKL